MWLEYGKILKENMFEVYDYCSMILIRCVYMFSVAVGDSCDVYSSEMVTLSVVMYTVVCSTGAAT